ncbi:MAG: formylglycine-generating enzyme family protein [Lewinellaceae bacterium]|nr:formylglycine-generating enzyme family protein [Lewinellaceae bacterium]
MIYVNGGTFNMGSNEENSSKPIHQVTLSSFYIGKYEVTQAQWNAVMSYNPSFYSSCAQCPVERVCRRDIDAFLKILNSLTGERYRLPTEAEWEFAARGGNESRGYIYAGSNDPDNVAWYDKNSGKSTHPVGQKQPNELGLYDMSGNVTEWCSDWYGPYKDEAQSNPKGAVNGLDFVLRGGTCISNPLYLRCTNRSRYDQVLRRDEGGFRLVKPAL